jgi:hypothetical protein
VVAPLADWLAQHSSMRGVGECARFLVMDS